MGMNKPVYLLQRGAEVEDIVHITAIAVVDAQETESPQPVRLKGAVVAAN